MGDDVAATVLENGDNNPFARTAAPAPGPLPRKRGRPPGSRNKNPRRARRAATENVGATGESAASDAPKAEEARSPFDGEVAGEREQRENKASGKRARSTKARNIMDAFPLEAVAEKVIDMTNLVVVGVASRRYGETARALAYGESEKAVMVPLAVEILKDMDIQLTPGEALGLVAIFFMATKVSLLEADLAERRAAAHHGARHESEHERPTPPSADTVTMNASDAIMQRHNDEEAP